LRKILSLFLVLLFLWSLGCTTQTKEAEDLLKEAQAHFVKARGYVDKWSFEVGGGLGSTAELKSSLSKASVYLKRAENELKMAKANLKKIKSLKVPDWRKQHADLLIKGCEAESKVLTASEGATKALNKVVEHGINLEESARILDSVSKEMDKLNELLDKEKWKEVKKEAASMKKDLQKARNKVAGIRKSDVSGLSDYLKTIDLRIKLLDAVNRFADAAIKEDSSSAKKIADEMEKYGDELDRLGSPVLNFDSLISHSIAPFEEEMEQKRQEAESFLQSAERLYQENVK
jgi:hypothetical protein